MKIKEVAETDNDKLIVDAANDAHPPLVAMTNTTTAAAEEDGDDNYVGVDDGNDNKDAANNTKGGGYGSQNKTSIQGRKYHSLEVWTKILLVKQDKLSTTRTFDLKMIPR